jgi:hypothetical protein
VDCYVRPRTCAVIDHRGSGPHPVRKGGFTRFGAAPRSFSYYAGLLVCFSNRLHDGELADSVLKIAATIPMKRLVPGAVHEGMPFDVQEFMKQVEQTAAE